MLNHFKDANMKVVGSRRLGICSTWRIIPFSKWLITMVIVSTLSRVGLVINGCFMAYKWGLLTY